MVSITQLYQSRKVSLIVTRSAKQINWLFALPAFYTVSQPNLVKLIVLELTHAP